MIDRKRDREGETERVCRCLHDKYYEYSIRIFVQCRFRRFGMRHRWHMSLNEELDVPLPPPLSRYYHASVLESHYRPQKFMRMRIWPNVNVTYWVRFCFSFWPNFNFSFDKSSRQIFFLVFYRIVAVEIRSSASMQFNFKILF